MIKRILLLTWRFVCYNIHLQKLSLLSTGLPCGRSWVRLRPDQHSGSLKGDSDEKTRFIKSLKSSRKRRQNVAYAFQIMNLTYFHQHFNVITSKYLFFVASAIIAMSPAYFLEKAWSDDLWRHLLNISLSATWVNNGKHVRKRSFVFYRSWFIDFGIIVWLRKNILSHLPVIMKI